MNPKPIVRLEGWEYHEQPDPQWGRTNVLSGLPYGHPRLEDGLPVTTGELVGTRDYYILTGNTAYLLGRWSGRGLGLEALYERLREVAP